MVSIAEQARQTPMNATPFGFDAAEVLYPGVNTCATVTAFGARGLAGLHLGLFMGAGEEGGRGSEQSKMIDKAYLDLYLDILKKQAYVKAATIAQRKAVGVTVERKSIDGVIVAGALEVWQSSNRALWNQLKAWVEKLAEEHGLKPRYFQFDDTKADTVDIHVNRQGVQFKKTRTATTVNSRTFWP